MFGKLLGHISATSCCYLATWQLGDLAAWLYGGEDNSIGEAINMCHYFPMLAGNYSFLWSPFVQRRDAFWPTKISLTGCIDILVVFVAGILAMGHQIVKELDNMRQNCNCNLQQQQPQQQQQQQQWEQQYILQHESTVGFYCRRPFWQTEKHFFVFGIFALQIATEIAAVGNVAEKLIKKDFRYWKTAAGFSGFCSFESQIAYGPTERQKIKTHRKTITEIRREHPSGFPQNRNTLTKNVFDFPRLPKSSLARLTCREGNAKSSRWYYWTNWLFCIRVAAFCELILQARKITSSPKLFVAKVFRQEAEKFKTGGERLAVNAKMF